MRREDRKKYAEWLSATDDENTKAIVEAILYRRSWRGRMEAALQYIAAIPFMLLYSIFSAPGIALISFWAAFICGRISSH